MNENKHTPYVAGFLQQMELVHQKLGALHLTRRGTKFDSIGPLQKSRSSKFHQLNPVIWQKFNTQKPKYTILHDIAIENLRKTMVKQLSIFYDTYICEEPLYVEDEVPNRLYSWDRNDFFRRLSLDTVWLDVLKIQISKECLELRKFKYDLNELRRYLRLVLDVFLPESQKIDQNEKRKMFKYLSESLAVTTIGDKIIAELRKNDDQQTSLMVVLLNTQQRKFSETLPANRIALEKAWMDAQVGFPIKMRYQLNSYESWIKKFQENSESIESKLKEEIKIYLDKIDYERRSTQYIYNFYQQQIEEFKQRSLALSMKYDSEYDAIEHQISLKKISLDKLRTQHLYYIDQVARFHEELENWRSVQEQRRSKFRKEMEEKERQKNEAREKGKKRASKDKQKDKKVKPKK